MADHLKIFNFKNEKEPYTFKFSDDKSTILDVKKFIKDKERLTVTDLSTMKIYWWIVPMPDDVLVKDLIEKEAELYVLLPQMAKITASGKNFV